MPRTSMTAVISMGPLPWVSVMVMKKIKRSGLLVSPPCLVIFFENIALQP